MSSFFRFPRTPHLAWLGPDAPRDDKVLSPADAAELLAGDVVVEEKLDGANVGLSVDAEDRLHAQNRGAFITRANCHAQFQPLFRWLEERRPILLGTLPRDVILFGEWCYAVHSVTYDRLPDWFLAFDVYDRDEGRFWSVPRRDKLVERLELHGVPVLARGRFSLAGLRGLFGTSRFGPNQAEGLYVRRDESDYLAGRAKLVRPEFVQQIGDHWSHRALRTNARLPRSAG